MEAKYRTASLLRKKLSDDIQSSLSQFIFQENNEETVKKVAETIDMHLSSIIPCDYEVECVDSDEGIFEITLNDPNISDIPVDKG